MCDVNVKINSDEPMTTGQFRLSAVVIQYRILTVMSRNIWNLNITAKRVSSPRNQLILGAYREHLLWVRVAGA